MTPVSLAPATPNVRAADRSTTAKASEDGTRFDALLAEASSNASDRCAGGAAGSETPLAPAKGKAAARASSSLNDDSLPANVDGQESTVAGMDDRVSALGVSKTLADTFDEDLPLIGGEHALAGGTTPAAEALTVQTTMDVASADLEVVPTDFIATALVASDVSPEEQVGPAQPTAPIDANATATSVRERSGATMFDMSPETGSASSVSGTRSVPSPMAKSLSAEPDVASQPSPLAVSRQDGAPRHETDHEAPARSQAGAVPAAVNSAAWAAAAAALREALQRVAVPAAAENASAAQTTSGSEASGVSSPSRLSRLIDTSRTPAVAGEQAAQAKHSGRQAAATENGAVLSASWGDAVTTAAARQTPRDSGHSDLEHGSAQSYKAPAKPFAGSPFFAGTTAFGRALEHAAPAAPVTPAAFTSADLASVGPQIVKGLQLQVTAKGGDMRLTLTPEHLGTVTIEVRVEHDRVRATLTADTPAVRQWIATHQDDLRQSLTAAGLTLEDLVVREDRERQKQPAHEERDAPPQKRRNDASGKEQEVFEIVV